MEEIFLIVIGLIVGSFLNVVIHRLPLKMSIVKPRSFCPNCKTKIKYFDNIPVFSFIALLGKCRYCKAKISWQYPVVEIITAFGFLLTYKTYGNIPLYAAAVIIFISILIVLAFIDLKHMILPDELTIGGAVLFLIFSFFNPEISSFDAFSSAIGSALLFVGIYFFYIKVRKIEGIGFGDVKMMLLLGGFLGLKKLAVAVLLASVSGLLVGLFFIIFKRKSLKFALPFGTFLALGSFISIFWGNQILEYIRFIYW
jgi:leader peptidase (prepilin peptidase)/N-methyltransferase